MNIHDNMERFWRGERPDLIPFSIYGSFCGPSPGENPEWAALFERGLVPTYWCATFARSTKDLETVTDTYEEDGRPMRRTTLKTPVGEIYRTAKVTHHATPYWPQKPWLVTAEDYRVRTWIAEHTEISPAYDNYDRIAAQIAPWGLVFPLIWRTPMQNILVDLAGLEQFSYHLVDLEEEVMALHQALLKEYGKIVHVVAEGPGRFIEAIENFTAETVGPARYERLLLPVYQAYHPVLQQTGKIVGAHYDGRLRSVKDLIAGAPIDVIESLTEPPEGDMTLTQCREAWSDKRFWNNINISKFDLPTDQLQAGIRRSVDAAAPDGRGLAFEISEDLPVDWRRGIPAILDVLGY